MSACDLCGKDVPASELINPKFEEAMCDRCYKRYLKDGGMPVFIDGKFYHGKITDRAAGN